MRILMLARPNLLTYPGGDTSQILGTAAALRRNGLTVDVNPEDPVYEAYDLLHFFNIIDPEDIIGHLRRTTKPYVVSTVYLDYREYDKNYRKDMVGLAYYFFSRDTVEYLKTVGKWLLKGEQLGSPEFLWRGHRRSIKKILKGAAMLLPNSHNEYRRLLRDYKIEKDYIVVPNGVDLETFRPSKEGAKRDIILCVSRIEGNKNHLKLIQAMKASNLHLYIVGRPALNQQAYYRQCRRLAGPNVHFSGYVPQQELLALYEQAKVHVLPSWFETTGLSSLEAALMGCNVVISDRGDVEEYFLEDAWYCDPANPDSIREAIEKAYRAPRQNALAARIRKQFNWKLAAKQTLKVYRKVLGR